MLKKSQHPDYFLLIILIALSVFGILILASVSAPLSYDLYKVTDYYLKRQIIFGLIPGLILGIIAYFINLEWVRKKSFYAFITILFLMTAVFLPIIGHSSGGAYRWLKIGSYTIQPAEFLKLLFILYLSGILANIKERFSSKSKKANEKRTLVIFLVIVCVTALLLLTQKDLSTLLVVSVIAITIYFYSGAPIKYLLIFLLGMAIVIVALILLEPYRLTRIFALFSNTDITNEGYQMNQALISIGSGGIGGVGLGMSYQRFGFVPAAISDAIFPILAEETGLIGSVTLIGLFLAFSLRGFKIVRTTPEYYLQYVALGITVWITFQGLINITSMVKIMPILGIPLPFVSHGGSALINEMIAMGLLLNISKKSVNL